MDRRSFLGSLVATASGLLVPGWGQRVFPMYPRVSRITINDMLNFHGWRFVLELPPVEMEAYLNKVRWQAVRDGLGCPRGELVMVRSKEELECEGYVSIPPVHPITKLTTHPNPSGYRARGKLDRNMFDPAGFMKVEHV